MVCKGTTLAKVLMLSLLAGHRFFSYERLWTDDAVNVIHHVSNHTASVAASAPSRGNSTAQDVCQSPALGSSGRFDRTLLIMIFNYDTYIQKNFALHQRLYGAYFPNIKYCSATNFLNDTDAIHAPLHINRGSLTYQCTEVAMQLFPGQFDGYLSVGDDALLGVGRLSELPLTEMWLESEGQMQFSTRNMEATGGSFALWSRLKPGGAESALEVEQNNKLDPRFRSALKENGWFHASADVYYFPASVTTTFQHLAPIFLDSQVYFSNAIATMMHLIQNDTVSDAAGQAHQVRIVPLHGASKWWYDENRTSWQDHIQPHVGKADYYHPLKLNGFQLDDPSQREMLCAFLLASPSSI